MKPYKELRLGRYILRYFPNKNNRELFWHRDKKDREIRVIFGFVKLQLDDELPFHLLNFKKYQIPKEVYHRVIAKKSFIVLLKEI